MIKKIIIAISIISVTVFAGCGGNNEVESSVESNQNVVEEITEPVVSIEETVTTESEVSVEGTDTSESEISTESELEPEPEVELASNGKPVIDTSIDNYPYPNNMVYFYDANWKENAEAQKEVAEYFDYVVKFQNMTPEEIIEMTNNMEVETAYNIYFESFPFGDFPNNFTKAQMQALADMYVKATTMQAEDYNKTAELYGWDPIDLTKFENDPTWVYYYVEQMPDD